MAEYESQRIDRSSISDLVQIIDSFATMGERERTNVHSSLDSLKGIISSAQTDEVLGVHIIGSDAGNMIAELVIAKEFGASAEDIARTCHAHPTLTESIKEAALNVEKKSIHI